MRGPRRGVFGRSGIPHLEELDLIGNKIGDAGYRALAKAMDADALPALRELGLAGNVATEEAGAELQAALQ